MEMILYDFLSIDALFCKIESIVIIILCVRINLKLLF